MLTVFAGDPLPASWSHSLFLAGPTRRQASGGTLSTSWRAEALAELAQRGFDGVVFIPERPDGTIFPEKADQIAWETIALTHSDVVLFWVPRSLPDFPAMTTNDEWGMWKHSGRAVFGAPPEAERMAYQRWWAGHLGLVPHETLSATVDAALDRLQWHPAGDRAATRRAGCLRKIPLRVWSHPTLQAWLTAQYAAGHPLRDVELRWHSGAPAARSSWMVVLHPIIDLPEEGRTKGNEMVVIRPDVEAVCAFHRPAGAPWEATEVVVVREFRSPTRHGAVLELPGGSSPTPGTDPAEVAATELWEETGIRLSSARLERVGTRQVAPTLLAHTMGLWRVALTADELAQARTAGWRGERVDDGEWVEVQVRTIAELLADPTPDWGVLGAIMQACPPVIP